MTASVIMNTVNENPDYLRQAIESYLQQENVKVELIISTLEGDKNLDLIRSYPVKVVTSPPHEKSPSGSYKQINAALPEVTGDWFCFASGNDTAMPDKIHQEIMACVMYGKEVAYSAFNEMDNDGNITLTRKFHPYDHNLHLLGNFVSDCSLISRRLIDKYAPFNTAMKNFAYWDLWLRIYKGEGDVFVYNHNPTWNYRQNPESMHIKRSKSEEQVKQNELDRNFMLSTHQ